MQQHRYGVNVEPLPGQPSGARTLSVSVDCDAIVDYLNFAPAGHRLGDDRVTYPVMMTRLLDLFAKHDIRATFYCIGKPLREDAEAAAIMRTAVSAGHRMGNHTYNHHEMSSLSDEAQRSEIVEGHRTVEDVLGVTPIGYRGPAYFVSTPILEELAGLGYLYDTSANSAPLVDFALSALSMLRTFRRKPRAPLQNLFTTDKASVIRIGSTRMMEWPIPVALGLPFYGTFHSVVPRAVFRAQLALLDRQRHIHYELHPIELTDTAIAEAYPWLPTARAARGRDLRGWLDERLGALRRGRECVTLEDMSVATLSALH